MFKVLQFIGSVLASFAIALLVPYAFYRFSPDMWIILQFQVGFGLMFGTLFFIAFAITMWLFWRVVR